MWPSARLNLSILWRNTFPKKMGAIVVLTSNGCKMLQVDTIRDCIYYGDCYVVSFYCLLLLLLQCFCPQITKPQLVQQIRVTYNWHDKKPLGKMAILLIQWLKLSRTRVCSVCCFLCSSWCITIVWWLWQLNDNI